MAGRAKDLIAADVQKLITLLSGFTVEEDPENFELCEKFAFSNLLHHRFLSVDSHAIRRSVFGMVTKFMIHGHTEASRRLDLLLNKYMSCDPFKDKDIQWAALSLLVKLADNPTSHISEEKMPSHKVEEKENTKPSFDWTTYSHLCDYLKEGNEEFDTNFHSSSESEEWEDLSEGEKPIIEDKHSFVEETKLVPVVDDSHDVERQNMIGQLERRVNAEEWLSNNIQKPWWHSKQITEKIESAFSSANLVKKWDNFHNTSTSTISEYKVVREILWMLQAPTNTTLFQEINGKFSFRPDISIPSLTKDSMTSYLNPLCDHFNMIHNLQTFQKEMYPMEVLTILECTRSIPSHTFESYTSAVIEFLRELQKLSCDIENKVKAQEDIYTLYSLNLELAPKLSQLRALYTVHVSATHEWKTSENWLSAARLLSVLYSAALSCMECDNPCILLRTFLKSFRPYVDIIDNWLTEGRLDDFRNEFIIAKRSDAELERWGSEFVLRDYVSALKSAGVHALPVLQIISERVLYAGRSMQLLQRLDRLADMRSQHTSPGRMYVDFLEALDKEIAQLVNRPESKALEAAQVTEDLEMKRALMSDQFMKDVPNQLENLKDSNMMQAFKDYFPFKMQSYRKEVQKLSATTDIFRKLATYSTCGLIPLKPVMERIISQLIDARHAAACHLVKTIFLEEFNLPSQLALIRAIFLMEAGDIMHRFCVFIFKDAEECVLWANSYVLTAQLEECINLRYPDHSSKFSVVIRDDAKLSGTPSAMDEISIKYSVEWPLTLILSPANMEYYNSVFQFLLKVKWALWALQELRFANLSDAGLKDRGLRCRARCLHLLRFWLLHSVGSVHTYLMGQVLHSLGLQLENDLVAATDLDSLLHAHSQYVTLVHMHCLQPSSSDVIKAAIMQMVQLSLELHELWIGGVSLVPDTKLIGMTEMYIKCHCFLGSVLQNAVETGHLMHCASSMVLSSTVMRESNLFSDHMKYSLTFLAWQKESPSGINFPLPKCLHKYLEKGAWNEERTDNNVNSQKLEFFLDNYFMYISRRKKLINNRGMILNMDSSFSTNTPLEIAELKQSNHNLKGSSSYPSSNTSKNIHDEETPSGSSAAKTKQENSTEEKSRLSHSPKNEGARDYKRNVELVLPEDRPVPSLAKDKGAIKKKRKSLDQHVSSDEKEDKISIPNHSYSHFRGFTKDDSTIKIHVSESYRKCGDNNLIKANNSEEFSKVLNYYESTTKNHNNGNSSSPFHSKTSQDSELLKENDISSDQNQKKLCLVLNKRTLKSIRQKCVRPNIKHCSKSGRKFYECFGCAIPNMLKPLKRRSKTPPSVYTHYNLSITQEKISRPEPHIHQNFPSGSSCVVNEICGHENHVIKGNGPSFFARQLKETITCVNERKSSIRTDSINQEEDEINIKTSVASYLQNKLSTNWSEKLEELSLHLLKQSFCTIKDSQDADKMHSLATLSTKINDVSMDSFVPSQLSSQDYCSERTLERSRKFILGHPVSGTDAKETHLKRKKSKLDSDHSSRSHT